MQGQAPENALLTLAAPGDQERGVKALAAQQGADGAGLIRGGIGLGQNALFVRGREGPALGAGAHLRVRPRRGGQLGRGGRSRRDSLDLHHGFLFSPRSVITTGRIASSMLAWRAGIRLYTSSNVKIKVLRWAIPRPRGGMASTGERD